MKRYDPVTEFDECLKSMIEWESSPYTDEEIKTQSGTHMPFISCSSAPEASPMPELFSEGLEKSS
jgi:hypothetical protein